MSDTNTRTLSHYRSGNSNLASLLCNIQYHKSISKRTDTCQHPTPAKHDFLANIHNGVISKNVLVAEI